MKHHPRVVFNGIKVLEGAGVEGCTTVRKRRPRSRDDFVRVSMVELASLLQPDDSETALAGAVLTD